MTGTGKPQQQPKKVSEPPQHPAPDEVVWRDGAFSGLGAQAPGPLLLGRLAVSSGFKHGWGIGGGPCRAGCPFWLPACGLPVLEAPVVGEEGSPAANICWGMAGVGGYKPGVVLLGHSVGCPQLLATCLPVPVKGSKQQAHGNGWCAPGTCQHCWYPVP